MLITPNFALWAKRSEHINRVNDGALASTDFCHGELPCSIDVVKKAELDWHQRIEMLPGSARLRRSSEIQRVLHVGRCVTSSYLRICTHPSAVSETRIACVVGKSVHASAVQRHRYQRWLRELAREWLAERPLTPAYDMVWIAQPPLRHATSLAEVRQTLAPHLQKLRATLAS